MHRNVPQVSYSLVNMIKTTYSAGQARFRHQGAQPALMLTRNLVYNKTVTPDAPVSAGNAFGT